MWRMMMLTALALVLAGVVYLTTRFRKLLRPRVPRALPGWLLAAALTALPGLFALINVTAMAVVYLHLILFWLLADLMGLIINKLRRKKPGRYAAGLGALAFTAVYLAAGWFFAHHIYATGYELTTAKDVGDGVRIVAMADAHLGITLDGEEFAALCRRVEAEGPDAVVLVGDFVDDDSEKADMLRACEALGELTAPVYFVYGNHDQGYFGYRNFTPEELRGALLENGVTVLTDETARLADHVVIAGRRDRSMRDRLTASELTEGLDPEDYVILLDHQPNDYAGEAASGADLVLSGHTHGGHIFPAGQLGLLMGANDSVYGREVRGATTFIVTSGVSGWAIPFKTGCISEYAVIDILGQ